MVASCSQPTVGEHATEVRNQNRTLGPFSARANALSTEPTRARQDPVFYNASERLCNFKKQNWLNREQIALRPPVPGSERQRCGAGMCEKHPSPAVCSAGKAFAAFPAVRHERCLQRTQTVTSRSVPSSQEGLQPPSLPRERPRLSAPAPASPQLCSQPPSSEDCVPPADGL